PQMGRLVAQVGNGKDPVFAEAVLYAEIPLSDARRVNMRRQKHLRICQREGDIFARWRERERIASRHVSPWVAELVRATGVGDLGAVGRILSDHTVRYEGPYRVVEECRAGPDAGPAFAVGIVDEAKSRRQ